MHTELDLEVNAVLPLLVSQCCQTPLLSNNPQVLLQRASNRIGGNLGVLVVPSTLVNIDENEDKEYIYEKTDLQAALIVSNSNEREFFERQGFC